MTWGIATANVAIIIYGYIILNILGVL